MDEDMVFCYDGRGCPGASAFAPLTLRERPDRDAPARVVFVERAELVRLVAEAVEAKLGTTIARLEIGPGSFDPTKAGAITWPAGPSSPAATQRPQRFGRVSARPRRQGR